MRFLSVGNIAGLVTTGDTTVPPRPFQSVWRAGSRPGIAARGRVVLGAEGGPLGDATIGDGVRWSVAVCGKVDSVGGETKPAEPAAAIARALDRAGIEASREVSGEFACLATDGDRLIAFKDHIGSHGLFAGSAAGATVIASRPGQVAAGLRIRQRADIDAMGAVFFSRLEDDEELPVALQGVDRVPRGYLVEAVGRGWKRTHRLWDPTHLLETLTLTSNEARDRAWELLSVAVERCLDGPTAVTLSGGVDSTLVAAALASLDHEVPFGAISAVYPESPSVDESAYIEETVGMLGLAGTTYQPNSSRISNIDLWVDRCDEPTMGLALGPLESMNQVAREAGYRTVLTGEMGEVVYDARKHVVGRILVRGRLSTARRHLAQQHEAGASWASLARIVGASLAPSTLALSGSRRRPAPGAVDWMDPGYSPDQRKKRGKTGSFASRWRDLQLMSVLGPSFPGLELSTIVGDHAGVRTRRPLLDRELWEFFLSLPPEVKFPDAWTKSLVRRVLDGRAPDSVIWRTDKTFFDEDAERNAEYPELIRRLSNGFELPGVLYGKLFDRLESKDMKISELARVRHLVSIHTFVAHLS